MQKKKPSKTGKPCFFFLLLLLKEAVKKILLPVMNNNHMSEFAVQLKLSSVAACICVHVEGEQCLSPGIKTAAD